MLLYFVQTTLSPLRGHVQTIFGKINVIVMLRAGPPLPPPPLNVMDFISYNFFNPHLPLHSFPDSVN